MIIASPQEPEDIRVALAKLCMVKVHIAPEGLGADYTFQGVWEDEPLSIGVQRKTEADLIASYRDGRLNDELTRLSQAVDIGIVLVEGQEAWNEDGTHPFRAGWTLDGLRNALGTIQQRRFIVTTSRDHADTARRLHSLQKYYAKKRHSSVLGRAYYSPEPIPYGIRFLQGIPKCGLVRATKIYNRFGVPMRWVISESELAEEAGPSAGADIYKFLGGDEDGRNG